MPILFETTELFDSYRAESEDRGEILQTGDSLVMIVADGMGGRPGGAVAAEAVVTRAIRDVDRLNDADSNALCGWLLETDRELHNNLASGETTAVIAVVSSGQITGASVGDSGAFWFGKDDWQDLTASQIQKPGIGTGGARPVGFQMKALPGTLLLASDGLYKYLSVEEIALTLAQFSPHQAAIELRDQIIQSYRGLLDDLALLLCHITENDTASNLSITKTEGIIGRFLHRFSR